MLWGQPLTDFFLVLYGFCAELTVASHLRRERRTTVDAGETDAAPGGLSTEVTPLRGTGENSCGQQ